MAATGSFLVSFLGMLGSTFPDSIEHVLWGEGRGKHHRKTSHWFVPYVGGFFLCFWVWGDASLPDLQALSAAFADRSWPSLLSFAAFWFGGGLLHIAEDACCGKVPLLNPYRKTFGWKFFRMSKARGEMSRGEAIFVIFVAVSCLYAWWQRYGF